VTYSKEHVISSLTHLKTYNVIGETKRKLKDRFNEIADTLTNKQTALSPPQYPNILCVTITRLLTSNLFHFNSINLIVTVHVKKERYISLKEVKPLNLMVLIRKMKLCTFLLN